MIFMSESIRTDIEQKIGNEVAHFVYKVPKKNHDCDDAAQQAIC
jgi:hypothetical protein